MFKLLRLNRTSERVDSIDDIRSAMERREDYMSMRLPRSFANTIAELFSKKLSSIDSELREEVPIVFQKGKNNRSKKTASIAPR